MNCWGAGVPFLQPPSYNPFMGNQKQEQQRDSLARFEQQTAV